RPRGVRIVVVGSVLAVVLGVVVNARQLDSNRSTDPSEFRSAREPSPVDAATLTPAVDLAAADLQAVARAADEPAVARAAEAALLQQRQPVVPALQVASGDDRPPTASAPTRRVLTLPTAHAARHTLPLEGSVTVIGEATLLIRSHGLTVLTDPNFLQRGEHARLAPALWAARRADPAIDLDALPPIDLVIVSRLREDHFDRLARRRLPRELPVIAPAEARSRLFAMGFSSVHALPPWGSLRIERGDTWLQLTATPTRTAPALLARLVPASMGTLLEFGRDDLPATYRMWISGDTVVDETLAAELQPRLGTLDLALLHVGGASVFGLGGSMDAAGSLRTVERLAPRTAIPLRLDDFATGPTPAPGPAAAASTLRVGDLQTSAGAPRIKVLNRGDTHRFAPVQYWALVRGNLPAAP
ncbi:MAG: MBL fold metallo-hydrolase, partial [Burkholderiaceae bacterium]